MIKIYHNIITKYQIFVISIQLEYYIKHNKQLYSKCNITYTFVGDIDVFVSFWTDIIKHIRWNVHFAR